MLHFSLHFPLNNSRRNPLQETKFVFSKGKVFAFSLTKDFERRWTTFTRVSQRTVCYRYTLSGWKYNPWTKGCLHAKTQGLAIFNCLRGSLHSAVNRPMCFSKGV